MDGLMMDYPLTLSTIFRRAESVFPRQEVVWRNADRSISRYTFGGGVLTSRPWQLEADVLGKPDLTQEILVAISVEHEPRRAVHATWPLRLTQNDDAMVETPDQDDAGLTRQR